MTYAEGKQVIVWYKNGDLIPYECLNENGEAIDDDGSVVGSTCSNSVVALHSDKVVL